MSIVATIFLTGHVVLSVPTRTCGSTTLAMKTSHNLNLFFVTIRNGLAQVCKNIIKYW